MLQASGRLRAGAGTPAPKAVSPPPIAPPTSPARIHPTTSRLAFAPSTVPNSSELTTADITSFAVFTAASQPIRTSAMASRHLPMSRLAQSHSMIAIPAPKAMPACSGIPAALIRMPGFSSRRSGKGEGRLERMPVKTPTPAMIQTARAPAAGFRSRSALRVPQVIPSRGQDSKRASPLPSWFSRQGKPGGLAARTLGKYITGRSPGPARAGSPPVSVPTRVFRRRHLT